LIYYFARVAIIEDFKKQINQPTIPFPLTLRMNPSFPRRLSI